MKAITLFHKNGCISLNNGPISKIQNLAYSGEQPHPINLGNAWTQTFQWSHYACSLKLAVLTMTALLAYALVNLRKYQLTKSKQFQYTIHAACRLH